MEQVGKSQLRKVLGKGASGTVYLALDTFSGADVALKVLDPELVSSLEFGEAATAQEIPDSDKFTALKRVALLQRLDDGEIWELVHAGRWARLPGQRAIVTEGRAGACSSSPADRRR